MEAAENIEISEVLQNNNSGTVNEILQNTYSISCIACRFYMLPLSWRKTRRTGKITLLGERRNGIKCVLVIV